MRVDGRARTRVGGWRVTTALNMFVCFLATRGASAESCGPWRVRKVSDGVQGVEISLIRGDGLSGEGLGAVRANGRKCVRRRVAETETTTTCLALAPKTDVFERGLEFVRRGMREGGSNRLEIWLATSPPKLIVDRTANKRHALHMMESTLNEMLSDAPKNYDQLALTRILDGFTNGDREYEEGSEFKAFIVADSDESDALDSFPKLRAETIAPPRSGGAEIVPLSSNVTKTIEELENRQKQLFRVFCCVAVGRSRFQLSVGNTTCDVSSPSRETSRHLRGLNGQCNSGGFPYPDDIMLEFTPEERKTFDQYRSFYKGRYEDMVVSKSPFALSVRFDRGPRLRAEARFRGVSSFRDCRKRKSLKIELSKPVRLMRGALSDKFLLISMCIDDRYVKTYLVLSMAKKLGLFPHAIRYVRLRIRTRGRRGIEHGGLYLLMDEPKSALARSHNELAVVVRRRNDPARKTMSIKAIPDVTVYPGNSDIDEIAGRVRYERVVLASETCSSRGSACFEQLNGLIDIVGYLRWLALSTWVESGDYVDELWLFASNEADRQRFLLHAWDPDDSFETCHRQGRDAIGNATTKQFLYCAEGTIDRVLVRSSDMMMRYLKELNYVLREGLTDGLHAIVIEQERQIKHLMNNETALGLTELRKLKPSINSADDASVEMINSLRYYETLAEERRRTLLRNPYVYAAWGDDEWSSVPLDENCDGLTVKMQIRSYDKANQDVLFDIIDVKPFALNISFNPEVVYNDSTYFAVPEEFELATWPNRSTTCTSSSFGDGFVMLTYACESISSRQLFSLHHRFWHSFANISNSIRVQRLRGCGEEKY